MRFRRISGAICAATLWSSAALAGPAPSEVVYAWERVVTPEGEVAEAVVEDQLMRELDSGAYSIRLDTLQDSFGRDYRMEGDAGQAVEGGEVRYAMRLVRVGETPRLTQEELAAAYIEARPKATGAELAAYLERRLAPDERDSTAVELDQDLQRWLATAGANEQADIVVLPRAEVGPLNLPRVASSLFAEEPALALRQLEARTLRIEERKSELEAVYAPIVVDIEREGGALLQTYWLLNGFEVRVDARGLIALSRDSRVARLELRPRAVVDENNLDDMREAAQIPQFHDAGIDGETGSGRSAETDMYIAFIDTTIDADHPAWRDTSSSSSSRLVDIWRKGFWGWSTVSTSATSLPSHGTKVVGCAVADLMQGQDSSITSSTERDKRTGFAPEASFSFIEEDGAGPTKAIEKAVELGVDVINMSMSFGTCELSDSSNEAVDEAMLDGIFFAKSASNSGHSGSTCNVGTPAAASGSFTVGAIKRIAVPLNEGDLTDGSCRGGDSLGRSVVAIAAYSGPEGDTSAAFDDTYGVFGATSSAAPVVAGSAAVLKDHLMDIFSTSIVNNAGYLYATMMLMGDGELEGGGTASATTAMDDIWGAGRLRMRMFNGDGMDGPWRMRLFSRVISDGEVETDLLVNPDSSGVNQEVSADVERLKATAYWHEPNIEHANQAEISLAVCKASSSCYTGSNPSDQHQRVSLGNAVSGEEWYLKLTGLYVPKSKDSNYYHREEKRKVYVAMYFEDTDRDDSDGPNADIE